MARMNNKLTAASLVSSVTSVAPAVTAQGGKGYTRDAKSELYLLAIANFYNQDTFYETGDKRDTRFAELVKKVAVEDLDWISSMAGWLRSGANMRTASLVMGVEAVKARLDARLFEGNAKLLNSVMQRADEPGEVIAYWRSKYGRTLPEPVLKALKWSVSRLFNERSYLKWDSSARGMSFADILRIVHPDPVAVWQDKLFKAILDRSFGNEADLEGLDVLKQNRLWRELVASDPTCKLLLDPGFIKSAGLTWEDVLSALGSKVNKKLLWEAIIPSMGYMALLRNLRNFDQAGVSDEVASEVIAKLTDPDEVERSRQMPMRFYSAYKAAPSLRWGYALEKALEMTLKNIPKLKGRTLILVDSSGSMSESFSKDGSVHRWDAAVLFGVALARECADVDVVSFSSGYWGGRRLTMNFPLVKGESLLSALKRWEKDGYFIGGGTDTVMALQASYRDHDRVVILTDEQAGHDGIEVSNAIPAKVPLYTWNLAGYKVGHAPSGSGNRHVFGGLTDSAFTQIALLENRRAGSWPWQVVGD